MKDIKVICGGDFLTRQQLKTKKKFVFWNKYPEFETAKILYYPMWIVFIEGIADRPPFKPKKMQFVGYIDPFLKDSGLIGSIPTWKNLKIDERCIIESPSSVIDESTEKAINKILKQDIRKLFVLKLPKFKVVSKEIIHLPCWVGKLSKVEECKVMAINCINGLVEYRIGYALNSICQFNLNC